MIETSSGIDFNDLFEKLPRCGNWTIWELRKKNELYKEFHHDCDPYAKNCSSFGPEIDQKSKRNIILNKMKAKNPTSVHLRIFN